MAARLRVPKRPARAAIPPDRKAVAPYSVTIFPLSLGSSPVVFATLAQDLVQSPGGLQDLHIFRFDITHAEPLYIFTKDIANRISLSIATPNPLVLPFWTGELHNRSRLCEKSRSSEHHR